VNSATCLLAAADKMGPGTQRDVEIIDAPPCMNISGFKARRTSIGSVPKKNSTLYEGNAELVEIFVPTDVMCRIAPSFLPVTSSSKQLLDALNQVLVNEIKVIEMIIQYLSKLPDKIPMPDICTQTVEDIRTPAKILIAQERQSNGIGKCEDKPLRYSCA
jgi:hypothetical protein